MIDAALVCSVRPFDALAPVLTERGIPFRTIDALDGDRAAVHPDAAVADEDDTALLQLTSGSTAEPKAVRITHGNLHANITAMAEAARLDVDRDVHGVVAAAVPRHGDGRVPDRADDRSGWSWSRSPRSTSSPGPLLWAELISQVRRHRHRRAELRLRRARPASSPAPTAPLDLSSLRIALNGAEPIDPDAVGRARRRRGAVRPAPRGGALRVRDGGDRARGGVRAGGHRAAGRRDRRRRRSRRTGAQCSPRPAPARSFPKLGPPLPGIEVRVVGDGGAVLGEREVGVLQLRGPSVTPGYLTVTGRSPTQDAEGWFDTGDEGYLADGAGRRVRQAQGRDHHGRPQHLPDRHRARRGHGRGVRAGNAVAVRLDAGEGRHRESFAVAVESRQAGDPRRRAVIGKDVTCRVVSAVGVRPARGGGAGAGQPAQDAVGQAAPRRHRATLLAARS